MTATLQILAAVIIILGLLAMFGVNLATGAMVFGIGSAVLALAWILEELKKISKKLDK